MCCGSLAIRSGYMDGSKILFRISQDLANGFGVFEVFLDSCFAITLVHGQLREEERKGVRIVSQLRMKMKVICPFCSSGALGLALNLVLSAASLAFL